MTSRGFLFSTFLSVKSNKKPYGTTVKPEIMKYYTISISKFDWYNASNCTKFVACVCAETCKAKHFEELVSILKQIYPVGKYYTERKDENELRYIGTDGLLHFVECELTLFFQE